MGKPYIQALLSFARVCIQLIPIILDPISWNILSSANSYHPVFATKEVMLPIPIALLVILSKQDWLDRARIARVSRNAKADQDQRYW